jgi:hypothetical protein
MYSNPILAELDGETPVTRPQTFRGQRVSSALQWFHHCTPGTDSTQEDRGRLTPEMIRPKPPTLFEELLFYYNGLTGANRVHKHMYVEFRAALKVLEGKLEDMSSQLRAIQQRAISDQQHHNYALYSAMTDDEKRAAPEHCQKLLEGLDESIRKADNGHFFRFTQELAVRAPPTAL